MYFSLPRVSVLLSLVAVCVVAYAQAPEPQVAGRVVRSDNGLPIEGAEVELVSAWALSSNGQYPTAITNKNGEYEFVEKVKADAYRIRASAEGFLWQTYSRDGTVEGQLQRIDVPTQLRGIDFGLKREAIVRGVLTDAEGKSAGVGISVAAVRKEQGEKGTVRLRVANLAKTDASGRFALTKLESGTYFACVNGPNGLNAFPNAGKWYRETWYGNVSLAEDAKALILKEGEEQNDIRITVEQEQRYRVIVWPSGPEDQPNPDRYSVRIEGRSHSSRREPDGSYVIPGIPPGRYRLVSVAWLGSEYQGEGDITFDVTNADVTLHLVVGGLGEIQGVVKSDDPQAKVPSGVMIGIESHEGAAQGRDVDAAGHFTFGRVLPGGYEFKLLKNPGGVVLRSVRCRGAVVTADTPLRMGDREKVKDCEALLGTDASATGREIR
jgi:Carboxypeptidase regulatory-like domain